MKDFVEIDKATIQRMDSDVIVTTYKKNAVIDVIDKASLSTMSVKTVSNQEVKSFVIKIILIEQETIDSREKDNGA